MSWTRTQIDTLGTYFSTGLQPARNPESQHALGVETVRFRGPFDFRLGLTAVYDLNRYFTRDEFNLNAVMGARWNWR